VFQGYSVPGACSDAGLAEARGHTRRGSLHYIVNGQNLEYLVHMLLDLLFWCAPTLRPSSNRHHLFAYRYKIPGITVRPSCCWSGGHEVNEVWFEKRARAGRKRIGEENRGWDHAKFLLLLRPRAHQ